MRRSLATLCLVLLAAACAARALSPTTQSAATTTPAPSESPAPLPATTTSPTAPTSTTVDAELQQRATAPARPAPSPTPRRDVDTWAFEAPNGRWIARVAVEYPAPDSDQYHRQLVVTSVDGAVEWTVIDEWAQFGLGYTVPHPIHWSRDARYLYFTNKPVPDGCALFVNGSDLHRLDLQTGQSVEMLPPVASVLSLSPDETTVAYLGWKAKPDLVLRDLTTGAERRVELEEEFAQAGNMVWSPDARQLLLTLASDPCQPPTWEHSIVRVDTTALTQTVLIRDDARRFTTVEWSSTDQAVLRDKDGRLWRLDTVTGDVTMTSAEEATRPDDGQVAQRLGKGTANDFAWSPDGKTVAVAAPLGLYLYAAATQIETRFVPTPAEVLAVAFGPDGALLAGTLADRSVRLWDASSGELLETLHRHARPARRVAFSADGRWLASGTGDDTLRIWDVRTSRESQVLPIHPRGWFVFSPDGRWLAIGGGKFNRSVEIWDSEIGEITHELDILPDLADLAFSPDGGTLAVMGSGAHATSVVLWDFVAGHRRWLESPDRVRSVAFSPDGSLLATGDWGHMVRLWSTATGEIVRTLGAHEDAPYDLIFSRDGTRLASADASDVKVWDLVTGEERHSLAVNGGTGLAFSPDGSYVAFRRGWTVTLMDVAGGTARSLPGHAASTASLAFSPSGRLLAVGDWSGLINLWDPAAGQRMYALSGHTGPVGSLAFSPDGRTLASGGINEDQTLRLWDVQTGQMLNTFTGDSGYPISDVTFSPDGRLLAGGGKGGVLLWDRTTGEMRRLEGHTKGVLSVAISPDGSRLASGSFDGTAIVWDLPSERALYTLPEIHGMGAVSLVFSADGSRLISGDQQDTIRVWETESGRLLQTIAGRGQDIALSPGGELLAFKKSLDDVVLWDIEQGQEVERWSDGRPIAFSPDGQVLASGSTDGIVVLRWADPAS